MESSIILLCITDMAVEDVILEMRNLLNTPLSVDSQLQNKVNILLTFRNCNR